MQPIQAVFALSLLLHTAIPSAQVAVSLDKMNALFPGLENPISIAVSDIPDSNLLLVPSTGTIRRTGLGQYGWLICHQDTTVAMLSIKDLSADTLVHVFKFRIKRIPEPAPTIARRNHSTAIPKGEFCGYQGGVVVLLQNFDFDLKCDVLHYDVQYITKGSDVVVRHNLGARYNSDVLALVQRAKSGDAYSFYNIAYRCGCDPTVRHLSTELFYKIR